MLVKNKKGEVEMLRYGAAMDAVSAGTHTLVNVKEGVTDGEEVKASDLKPETPKTKTDDKK